MNGRKKFTIPWEIGSEFHWVGLPTGPFLPWPEPQTWFALGRDALLAIWREGKEKNSKSTLLIPDYFCPDVATCWEKDGVRIQYYADDPRWSHPDWDTLTPEFGDLVLAVNYFGVRKGDVWQEWYQQHPFVVFVEDHSHDLFSKWAQSSTADYAFASIRKTFPVPDGALLWSPRNHPLPPEPKNQNWVGSALKLAGMIWKKEYLESSEIDLEIKKVFRNFQTEGEKWLSQNEKSSLSLWGRSLLATGFPQQWRSQREENIRLLLHLLTGCENFTSLFSDWPSGYCPFNVVLIFESELLRNAFRFSMISKGVYTPVHWGLEPGVPDHALELSKRILTIPVDQRYSKEDIYRIASILKELSI